MVDLLELADRCEKATKADLELDALIRCAVFAKGDAYVKLSPYNGAWCIFEPGYNGKERSWEPRGLTRLQRMGEFTSSIDAAMTLVPKGWDWSVSSYGEDEGSAEVWEHGYQDDTRINSFLARTPALCLVVAALRAKASGVRVVEGEG